MNILQEERPNFIDILFAEDVFADHPYQKSEDRKFDEQVDRFIFRKKGQIEILWDACFQKSLKVILFS